MPGSVRVKRRIPLTPEEKAEVERKKEAKRHMFKGVIELDKFLRAYDLDPTKNYKDDPTYGPTLRMILKMIHIDQLKATSTLRDEMFKKSREAKAKTNFEMDMSKVFRYPENFTRRQQMKYRKKFRKLMRVNADLEEAHQIAYEFALEHGAPPRENKK